MDYFTPIKDMSSFKVTRTAAQSREGDWICLNCNNLNFSFRKRCNRCKTQTRQQNQNSQVYSLYYYKAYNCQQKQQSHGTSANSNIRTPNTPNIEPLQPFNEKNREELMTPLREKTPEKQKKDLPSVSPLVKKYVSGSIGRSSEGSVWGVQVRQFEQCEGEQVCVLGEDDCILGEEQGQIEQYQLLLKNIML